MNALYLIGFVQSIFFIVLVFSKKKVHLRDFLLSSYLLILGLNLIFIYWHQTGFHDNHPIVIILDLAYWTLLGPILYMYVEITTSGKPKFKWKYLIHLFPLVFIFISFSGYFFAGLNTSFFEYRSNSPLFIAGYIVWMYNSPMYYIILIFKLRSHKRKIKHYYSSSKFVDLKWLNYLVHGFAVFLFFLLTNGYIVKLLNLDLVIDSYYFTWLVMVAYIFGIGYFGNKQRGIFAESEIKTKQVQTGKSNNLKGFISGSEAISHSKSQYSKTGLSNDEAILIKNRLVELMNSQKPYLEYDLTLPKLAMILGTSSHKLSQVINEKYTLNFFEFINKHRVADIKKLLKSASNAEIKIMALAYDCGFNSKSAFYTIFKKETSLTPTEYRNKHLSFVEV